MGKFDVVAKIHEFLTPKETLAPFVFDKDGVMFTDVRQRLLLIADFVASKTIAPLDGLIIEDICLEGSLSGYMYHEKSDFDLRLIVKNHNSKSLAKDEKHLNKFLKTQLNGMQAHTLPIKCCDRFVDVKIATNHVTFVSLYSILDNKWLIRPQKEFGLKEDQLLAYYNERKSVLFAELEEIKKQYKGEALAEQMEKFYMRMMNKSILGSPSIEDYFVYKLLSKEMIFRQVGAESVRRYSSALSLDGTPY